MNRTQRRSLLVTLGVAGATTAYVWGHLLPNMKAVVAIRQQVGERQDYIAQAEKMRPLVASLTSEAERTREYCERYKGQTPPVDQIAVVFGNISRLAKAAGTTTSRFEPQPQVRYKSIGRVPVVLAVSGTFASVGQLLASLEAEEAAIWVDELRMEPARQNSELVNCEINLGIYVDLAEKSD